MDGSRGRGGKKGKSNSKGTNNSQQQQQQPGRGGRGGQGGRGGRGRGRGSWNNHRKMGVGASAPSRVPGKTSTSQVAGAGGLEQGSASPSKFFSNALASPVANKAGGRPNVDNSSSSQYIPTPDLTSSGGSGRGRGAGRVGQGFNANTNHFGLGFGARNQTGTSAQLQTSPFNSPLDPRAVASTPPTATYKFSTSSTPPSATGKKSNKRGKKNNAGTKSPAEVLSGSPGSVGLGTSPGGTAIVDESGWKGRRNVSNPNALSGTAIRSSTPGYGVYWHQQAPGTKVVGARSGGRGGRGGRGRGRGRAPASWDEPIGFSGSPIETPKKNYSPQVTSPTRLASSEMCFIFDYSEMNSAILVGVKAGPSRGPFLVGRPEPKQAQHSRALTKSEEQEAKREERRLAAAERREQRKAEREAANPALAAKAARRNNRREQRDSLIEDGIPNFDITDYIGNCELLVNSSYIQQIPLDPGMNNSQRLAVHQLAELYGLNSFSKGKGKGRHPVLAWSPAAMHPNPADLAMYIASVDAGNVKSARGGGGTGANIPVNTAVAADAKPIHSSNIGHKMLKLAGWIEGKGLGSDHKGRTEPIEVIRLARQAGIGAKNDKKPLPLNQYRAPHLHQGKGKGSSKTNNSAGGAVGGAATGKGKAKKTKGKAKGPRLTFDDYGDDEADFLMGLDEDEMFGEEEFAYDGQDLWYDDEGDGYGYAGAGDGSFVWNPGFGDASKPNRGLTTEKMMEFVMMAEAMDKGEGDSAQELAILLLSHGYIDSDEFEEMLDEARDSDTDDGEASDGYFDDEEESAQPQFQFNDAGSNAPDERGTTPPDLPPLIGPDGSTGTSPPDLPAVM